MDYLTKDNISLDEDHSSAIKHYFSHKNYSKILKTLTKLDLMQLKNNLKSISGRIKKTYIVNDKIDLVVKNLDLEDVVFVVSSKNFDNLDFLIKSRNASKIIFKNCNKDLNTFLEENKFEEIHKSVFFR
jgi:glucose-6-phosphate isomerase